jgi:hypothetical protein
MRKTSHGVRLLGRRLLLGSAAPLGPFIMGAQYAGKKIKKMSLC